MYSFQAGSGRRKNKQLVRLLYIIIFILIIALVGVTYAYVKAARVSEATSEALIARAVSEAGSAQNAVYRLTQSSGTNTASLLATVRGHIYTLQSLNTLTSNIYGAGTLVADADLLTSCVSTLDQCDTRLQAGSVLTDLTTQLRDQIDELVASFSGVQ
ncbi:MAG: hypothetical protein ACI4MU_03025 [Candidatus Ventricola sp.]